MIQLFIALLFITTLIAFFVIYRLGAYIGQTEQRIHDLEKAVDEYKDCGPRRHTHSVAAGLDDFSAVKIDLALEAQELEVRIKQLVSNTKNIDNAIERMDSILGSLRQCPRSYDPDRPAGLRYRDTHDPDRPAGD